MRQSGALSAVWQTGQMMNRPPVPQLILAYAGGM